MKTMFKKALSLVLAIVILFATTIVVTANSPSRFSDAEVNINLVNGEVVVTGSFNSSATNSEKYKVYLSSHAADGSLIAVYVSEAFTTTYGANAFEYNAGIITNAVNLKAFVWTGNQKPISTPVEKSIRFSDGEVAVNYVDNKFVVSGSFVSSIADDARYTIRLGSYDFDNELVDMYESAPQSIVAGKNTFEYDAGSIADAKKLKAYVTVNDTDICESPEKIHSIKILGIGNSFTQDAMSLLYQPLKEMGIDKVVIAYLYKASCSLKTHWTCVTDQSAAYRYYKNTSDTWATSTRAFDYGLKNDKWDFITLQQASGSSGDADTYEPYLSDLIEHINNTKTNPKAKLGWHTTWAYSQDSTHSSFPTYNKDQLTMYNAILSAVKEKVYPHNEFSFYIPSGTAIQNARTSLFGDGLNRDGHHLQIPLGRYIASLTWLASITGMSIDNIDHVPNGLPAEYLSVIKECVNNAIKNPEKITQSQYAEISDIYDLNNYTQIGLGHTQGYWNSTSSSAHSKITVSTTAVATKQFSKEDLPNGSLIVIDKGTKYRPEGWQTLGVKNSSDRPENVTIGVEVVSDAWWGDFNYRAFNISYIDGTSITSDKVDEAASHFRIYIPKTNN